MDGYSNVNSEFEQNKYGKDENISEEDADKLVNDVENFRTVIARSIKI